MDSEITIQSKESDKKKQMIIVKLQEIGPRLQLKLVKIEDGLLNGSVVYHRYIHLSKQEQLKQSTEMRKKKKLKL